MHTIDLLEARVLLAFTFDYASAFGDEETLDSGNAVVVDAQGNTYFGGTFRGKIDVNKSNSKKKFLVADDNYDAFLVKYSPTGKLLWSQQYGNPDGDDTIERLVIGPNGDLYVTGEFEEIVDFDASSAVHKMSSHGSKDGFILRLTEDGDYIWAGHIGGELDDDITAFAIGPSGDMYYSGFVRLRGDADPSRANRAVFDRGVDDTIIARLNGTTGAIKWIKVFGEDATRETITDLVVDANESVLAAGVFNRTVAFDRHDPQFDRKAVGSDDIYLARLDSSGQFQWIKTIGGKKQETVSGMVQDDAGNLYITGNFAKTVDFEPGPGQTLLAAPGNQSAYILKMDSDANLTWARQIGAAVINGHDEDATIGARRIAIDSTGAVYTIGDFAGTVDFDPSSALRIVDVEKESNTPALAGQLEASDTYVLKLDGTGNFQQVSHFGGEDGTTLSHDIAVDAAGAVNITGAYAGFVDLDPTSGSFRRSTHNQHKDSNVFLEKLLP